MNQFYPTPKYESSNKLQDWDIEYGIIQNNNHNNNNYNNNNIESNNDEIIIIDIVDSTSALSTTIEKDIMIIEIIVRFLQFGALYSIVIEYFLPLFKKYPRKDNPGNISGYFAYIVSSILLLQEFKNMIIQIRINMLVGKKENNDNNINRKRFRKFIYIIDMIVMIVTLFMSTVYISGFTKPSEILIASLRLTIIFYIDDALYKVLEFEGNQNKKIIESIGEIKLKNVLKPIINPYICLSLYYIFILLTIIGLSGLTYSNAHGNVAL